MVVEGLYRSAGTIHYLRLQHLNFLHVRTQQFQRCLLHSVTEEEWAGRNHRGELQTSFQQIENYLSEANLLPSHQSAYRKHHSTETALLKVCSVIISNLDMGDCALLAFLDLSAAFDTVDKRILLERLSRSFGIDDIALKWFQSYLTNRTEYVLFNGIKSSKRVVQFGVPQGSVLSPLLFVLYTSDLERIAEKHNLDAHFYADDSQLYIFSKPQLADSAQTRLIACLDDLTFKLSRENNNVSDLMGCFDTPEH